MSTPPNITISQPAMVGQDGTLYVHGRAGMNVIVQYQIPGTRNLQDISQSDLYFEIDNVLRVALIAGANNYSRIISLTPAQLMGIQVNQPIPFALVDETGSVPVVPWSGLVRIYGYQGEPS